MAETQPQQEVRSTGKVRWFNDVKGFGFIAPDDGGEDLFVHQSSIKSDGFRTLAENEEVEFLITFGENEKTKAVDVTGPNGAPIQGNKKEVRGAGRGGGNGWRGGERRSSAAGSGCYNCGDSGHLARDCHLGGRRGNGDGGACFNCQEVGHRARDCPVENVGGGGGGGGSGGCYTCGELGHLARDCSQGQGGGRGGGGGGRPCYNCGEVGHFARDCSGQSTNGSGRFGGGGGGECYNCKKPGHFARDCPTAST